MSNPAKTTDRLRELAEEIRVNTGNREQIAEALELIAKALDTKPAPASPAKTTGKK